MTDGSGTGDGLDCVERHSLRRLVLQQHATPGRDKIQTCRQPNTKGLRAEDTGQIPGRSPPLSYAEGKALQSQNWMWLWRRLHTTWAGPEQSGLISSYDLKVIWSHLNLDSPLIRWFDSGFSAADVLLWSRHLAVHVSFALWACYSPDSFISALCCVAICWSCLCQHHVCLHTCVCVCVCLLIYFFRSLGDALVERTVTIGRVSLPGPSTRPTFVPGKYMQGVFLWPNRASGPPKLSSNTSLHISRMLNAAQHIAHKWNKGTCCDTDALLFLFQYFTWHRVSIYSFFAVYYAPTAHHFETNGISCRPDWFSRVLVHPHHCHWST